MSSQFYLNQTFGEKACHPERSEGSGSTGAEILRFAQDDSPDPSPVRFREALSPNISLFIRGVTCLQLFNAIYRNGNITIYRIVSFGRCDISQGSLN
jgi:hypothetical protein